MSKDKTATEVKRADIFPFGTHFYHEPSRPLEELLHDMQVVKRLGFNMLKLQAQYGTVAVNVDPFEIRCLIMKRWLFTIFD